MWIEGTQLKKNSVAFRFGKKCTYTYIVLAIDTLKAEFGYKNWNSLNFQKFLLDRGRDCTEWVKKMYLFGFLKSMNEIRNILEFILLFVLVQRCVAVLWHFEIYTLKCMTFWNVKIFWLVFWMNLAILSKKILHFKM